MTRSVVRHGRVDGAWSRSHFPRGWLLAHVTDSGAEVGGRFGDLFVVRIEMRISCEHRATTAGVCNDWSARVECRNVEPGKFACAFEIAGVCMQSAAAYLLGRCADIEVIRAQHTLRSAIHTCEEPFANTPNKHQYVLWWAGPGLIFASFFFVPLRLCVRNPGR